LSLQKIEFRTASLILIALSIVVALSIILLSKVSDLRRATVYEQYKQETTSYIDANRPGLTTLFTQVFPNEACSDSPTCPHPNQEAIAQLISHNLKDYSSMLFVKQGTSHLMQMGLAGDYKEFYPYKHEDQIRKLLAGELTDIPWDDYVYDFPQKEVIFPVKDGNGRIIGAIVRAVLEK
jgi:hypothetical protein